MTSSHESSESLTAAELKLRLLSKEPHFSLGRNILTIYLWALRGLVQITRFAESTSKSTTERYLRLRFFISQGAITSTEVFDFFVRKVAGPSLIKDFEELKLERITRQGSGEVEVLLAKASWMY
jgi:hypothetical protein